MRAARNEGAAKITASAIQRASGVDTSQREPSRATLVTTCPVFTLSPTISSRRLVIQPLPSGHVRGPASCGARDAK